MDQVQQEQQLQLQPRPPTSTTSISFLACCWHCLVVVVVVGWLVAFVLCVILLVLPIAQHCNCLQLAKLPSQKGKQERRSPKNARVRTNKKTTKAFSRTPFFVLFFSKLCFGSLLHQEMARGKGFRKGKQRGQSKGRKGQRKIKGEAGAGNRGAAASTKVASLSLSISCCCHK